MAEKQYIIRINRAIVYKGLSIATLWSVLQDLVLNNPHVSVTKNVSDSVEIYHVDTQERVNEDRNR